MLLLFVIGCQGDLESTVEEEGALLEVTDGVDNEGDDVPVRTPGKSYGQVMLKDETIIEYALIVPEDYAAGEIYPILLAFPPGVQTVAMVEAGLGYWEEEAAEKGWIVVSPVAPNQTLFFRGSERYLPEFLSHIMARFPPEGGKFHVAGVSNGGISAFRFAIQYADLVHSVLVLPGYPSGGDWENLANLKDIPVAMFVGENDGAWVNQMKTAEQNLSELGAMVTLEIVPGEGHVIRSLNGERLFDLLDNFREAG